MKKTIQKLEGLLEFGGIRKDIIFLVVSGIALLVSILGLPLPFDAAWIAIVFCGIPIVLEAVIGVITEFDIKADVLVSIALVASIFINEEFAAGEVAFIMQLGALLEELTVARARAGIERLVHLTPQTARIIIGDKENVVPAEQVQVGDIIRVLPGETVPVDGVITYGATSVNQAVMTGESLPVDKASGDDVSSGTVNQFGAFEMRAVKVGEDSSIQRMIRLVQSADAGKAKIVGIADRMATWVVVIALTAAILTGIISGEIIRAVTILVVFCPCALVLATPTAIMAAIGNATKHGFLVREGGALERLANVSRIVFDKTGTLTYGVPRVMTVKSILTDYTEDMLYSLAASAERLSEHPLGKAIVHCYKEQYKDNIPNPQKFSMVPGRGVDAVVNGKRILAGNKDLLKENGIVLRIETLAEITRYIADGATIIYIAIDNVPAGFIVLSDTIRKESAAVINDLKKIGKIPVLLTGDNENSARAIAKQLCIDEMHADCLPEGKLECIDAYQKKKQLVCMIGDGVNDAPALKRAAVGIAMGGVGSDIAMDSADIVLVDDEIKELPHLMVLSKRMMKKIKCNLIFSMLLNFIAICLAVTGILNPIIGALVHNAGSVIVIINSAFLIGWKKH